MRKIAILLATALLGWAGAPASAQVPNAAMLAADSVPPARGEEIPLSDAPRGDEAWVRVFGQTWVRNVSRPSLYAVRPMNGRANGKSVIVVPGGGYKFVSIESEGFRVADRLAAQGYTAFVLKYRPNPTPATNAAFMAELAAQFGSLGKGELADDPNAVDDLATAIDLIATRAAEWKLDPKAIGVVGFSAGSRTAIRLIEQKPQARRLAHVGLIYPPMTQVVTGGPRAPLFLAIAADDPLFLQGGLTLPQHWLAESKAVEFHLYASGGHGFGMFPKGTTSDRWIDQYLDWLVLR